ncbi:hypothetical protein [Ruminiclostridium papyrosolvens]|uniref:Primosomal protein n=1 Tax=Ruminiclostridium papyrosolvens C7 TaxID=1330534 RepID=U4QXL2_9FIRM|nr:hypothetical protein [Ruminiclostridium papyrosolvens]EPR09206.1 primosomal protein [Ruminiclostridium papyrosolvens C7]
MSNGFWDDDEDYDYDDDNQQEDADYDTEDANDEDEDSEEDDNEDDINDEDRCDESDENTADEKNETTDTDEVSRGYAQNSIIKQQSASSPSFHGYGKCMRYLCNCQHFESISGNTCSNCGHNYSDHW